MTVTSTLFYIYDNTNSEENTELQGKLLDNQVKDLIGWDQLPLFKVSEDITKKVLLSLK